MAGSLDTKTDPNQLPTGKLLELENGFRQRNGELIKRNGYETLGTSIIPSGTLEDGRRMALFGDELNVITNKSMYTYSDDADAWVRKGPLETLSVDQFPIVANSYQQSTADSATNGSYCLVCLGRLTHVTGINQIFHHRQKFQLCHRGRFSACGKWFQASLRFNCQQDHGLCPRD